MANLSKLTLSFIPLLVASSAFAQCPAGSPCAMRNSGNSYNSQYERPYGAPDYSQNEEGYDNDQMDQNGYSMTNRPVQGNPNMNPDMRAQRNQNMNPNMNPDMRSQRNPNMNPNMNPGVTNNPGAVTPPPRGN